MDPRHARAGGDLCEVCAALHRPGPAPGGAELPSHRHPPRDAAGGEASWKWGGCFVLGRKTLERGLIIFEFPFS